MICDFHNDVLTKEGAAEDAVPQGRSAGAVCAVFRGGRSFSGVAAIAERFNAERAEGLWLGLEDIGYFTRERSARICGWRPVYASLTWNGENGLAGGCLSEARLTPLGKEAVCALSESGICVDVSHLNAASFCDVLGCAPYGVVASHSCFAAVRKHPRNLCDWQAREIAACGGLIGVAFVGAFLTGGRARAFDAVRHIVYGAEKFGVAHICIGSDFCGTDDLPADLRGYTQAEALRGMLAREGFSAEETERILVGNLAEFLRSRGKRKEP